MLIKLAALADAILVSYVLVMTCIVLYKLDIYLDLLIEGGGV